MPRSITIIFKPPTISIFSMFIPSWLSGVLQYYGRHCRQCFFACCTYQPCGWDSSTSSLSLTNLTVKSADIATDNRISLRSISDNHVGTNQHSGEENVCLSSVERFRPESDWPLKNLGPGNCNSSSVWAQLETLPVLPPLHTRPGGPDSNYF